MPRHSSPIFGQGSLRSGGGMAILHREVELGEERYREALALFDELGDEYNAVGLRSRFVVHAGSRADPDEVRRLVAEVRALNETVGNPVVEPQMLSALGDLAVREDDWDGARDLYVRSVEVAREHGFSLWELWQLTSLMEVDLERKAPDDAERTGRDALVLARRLRDREFTLYVLAGMARAALELGAVERAGILWGALSEEMRENPLGRLAPHLHELAAPLRECSIADFLAVVEDGRVRTIEDAVALALGEDAPAQTVP